MLASGFSQEFDRQYGERLRQRVEGLLQSHTHYHHEISPKLSIDFQDGIVRFRNPHEFDWPSNQKETSSVPEACEIIKQYVWSRLNYCLLPEKERAKTVAGLESFLEQ